MRVGVVLGALVVAGALAQRWCGGQPAPVAATGAASAATEDPALPGITSPSAALVQRLEEALRARGAGYEPRTRHLKPSGAPKYVNRLILETSPYLLQHAHNPVNWHAWGSEAFARAAREGRPVLLSIGYSTCHWCHVMERESFEDEEIARFINEHFVAVKVDREERPDVDDVYMSAVQQLTGSGGWPMTLVLTADRRPFFGGTYFPPRDGERGARKGFLTILRELAAEHARDPGRVAARATEISEGLARASAQQPAGPVPGAAPIEGAVRSLVASFDSTWGGFGRAPKFPRPVSLDLLLRHHRRTRDPQSLAMVKKTLEQMAAGGIYDQIGGGFHRYATDARWLVPHFEKMLYDNAQLVSVYLAAFQLTKEPAFERVARETLEYVRREMTGSAGAFYSATDADSPAPKGHDEEGLFFTWTPSELRLVLGPDLARVAGAFWGVTPTGNFEGRSILHRSRSEAAVAGELELEPGQLATKLEDARTSLYAARAQRKAPLRDDKIVVAWNGLMISAFAQGAIVLGDRALAEHATRAARFILREVRDQKGRLRRTHKDGRASHPAVLDDYAFMIQGLLDLFEASSEPEWLEAAIGLEKEVDDHFSDPAGAYFGSAADAERLLTREKPSYDGAEPAGNSVALMNLLRLSDLTGKDALRERAEKGLGAFSAQLARAPAASPKMLCALERYHDRDLEIAIVAPSNDDELRPLLDVVRRTYLPNRSLVVGVEGPKLERLGALIPWLEGKRALRKRPTAFVCDRGRCDLPASDPAALERQLAKVKPLSPVPAGARPEQRNHNRPTP